MKKAVITTGGKQYLVAPGETVMVEVLKEPGKTALFQPLLVIDGDVIKVGTPFVEGAKVAVEVLEPDVPADKVTSIRYKAKKRVHTVRGHRQHFSSIKIKSIS